MDYISQMEIKPLVPVHIPNGGVVFTQSSSFDYTEPILQITMTKRINVVNIGLMDVEPNNINIDLSPLLQAQTIQFGAMQALIKSCVDNAEYVKNRLLDIALDIQKPKNEESRVALMKKDLMNLKSWFMEDVRSRKVYQHFKKYNSTKKLKVFSQSFNSFILDRNKYTHGQLCLIRPDYKFAIDYIDSPSQRQKYAYITIDNLKSFNDFYQIIVEVMNEYSGYQQSKIIESMKNKN